jgi:hypothetical protein
VRASNGRWIRAEAERSVRAVEERDDGESRTVWDRPRFTADLPLGYGG